MENKPMTTRRIWRILLLAAFILVAPTATWSQATLQIIEKRGLRFGEWAADEVGTGTVTIPPTSDTTTSSGGLISFGGNIKRARFQLIGEPKAFVIVTLPSSITIRKGTSSHVMTVDNFTMNLTNPVKLNNKGKKTINIGATLHVGAGQRQGNYNDDNTFTIFADYL